MPFRKLAAPLLLATGLCGAELPTATLLDHNHWKRARALVKPANAETFSQQSRIDWAYYDEAAAVKHSEQAIALEPGNSDFHFHFAQILLEAAERANKLRAVGLARRGRQEIDAALAAKPDNTFALFAKMLFLFQAPGIVGGDKPQAFIMAAQIERIEPARGSFGRARLAALDKKTRPQAEGYYLKAVELNPRYYTALVELAALYRVAIPPRYDQAVKYARAAQRAEPDRVAAYIALAETYASAGQTTELDKVLDEAEVNDSDDLAPYYRAAVILGPSDRERARRCLSKYLTQEPEAREPTHAEAKQLLSKMQIGR